MLSALQKRHHILMPTEKQVFPVMQEWIVALRTSEKLNKLNDGVIY